MREKAILLIEDNPYDETLTKEAFLANNFQHPIFVAKDGEEALAILFGKDNHYKLKMDQHDIIVLLDLSLPKISGIDVLRQIRAHKKTRFLPVIVMTSSKEESDIINSYQLHANSYIRKPINYADLVVAIKALGYYWLALNEFPPLRTSPA